MDILDKCLRYQRVTHARAHGVYPYFLPHDTPPGPYVSVTGKTMLSFASNDYLGLATHPAVRDAACAAIDSFGTGCGASRLLAGSLSLHEELEAALATFLKKQAAIVFTSGMHAAMGTLTALGNKNSTLYMDKLCHASLIDGAHLSGATIQRFPHNDIDTLDHLLSQNDHSNTLLIVEGVYSMEGDTAPLPAMIDRARSVGTRILLDDAHGIGVLGNAGAGTADFYDCLADCDIILGTFSKAFAAIGGFVAADAAVIDFIKHHARTLIFSAALPAPQSAAAFAALRLIQDSPALRQHACNNADLLRQGLREAGCCIGNSTTPIVPLIVGEQTALGNLWTFLHKNDIFTSPIIPPAVPPRRHLLRIAVTAAHTTEDIERLIDACHTARKKGIIPDV